RGQIERIGGEAIVTLGAAGRPDTKTAVQLRDHAATVEYLIGWLASGESGAPISRVADIEAVGHRVVHGGERFTQSVRVDHEVWRAIQDLIYLAPLHNPHNLRGIAAAPSGRVSGVPQGPAVATAFPPS